MPEKLRNDTTQEWQLAQRAAQREAEQHKQAALTQPVQHQLVRGHSGRPCLITNFPPETLARRYRYWAWAHATVFMLCLIGAPWVWNMEGLAG